MLRFDRRLIHHFDWIMLLMLVLVSAMSLASLFSSTWSGGPNPSPVFYKQLYLFLFGFVLILALISVDYNEFEKLLKHLPRGSILTIFESPMVTFFDYCNKQYLKKIKYNIKCIYNQTYIFKVYNNVDVNIIMLI